MKFTVEMLTRRVDYLRFRQVYFSESFNREIMKAVNLQERSTQERVVGDDGKERMRMRIVPKITLPGVIQKLLEGHPISYDEITVFDPQARQASFAIESLARDTVQVTGQLRFLDEGDGVRFRFEGDARVKVFGLGGLIERFLVGEVKSRYALLEQALQRFVDEGRDLEPMPLDG
jgi:hypothetical protein